jgi:hypothetical protein
MLCNLLAVVVAQRKTPGTKSERTVVAGEAGSRSISRIIKMEHCLEDFFDIRLNDTGRIYWNYRISAHLLAISLFALFLQT